MLHLYTSLVVQNDSDKEAGMSGIVIGKKTNGTGRDGTGLNGIERDGVKL